ncbi:GTP-binding protein [Sellimonas caecigallum]|uniref:GTPase n=1 Tax=Sellimonas caecigallum TaxID=2592333 RepID=A0ABS7L7D4_9FIRM|nr:GTP-binding protein [Sellimonas caecigallum]MBY0759006.1 hypothetical protein [Sellimonas caecigallum]
MDTVVELFTGFLDSGKTTLIKAALNSPDFLDYETTLLLVCEEGEEEYDEDYLSDNHIIKMVIDEEEKLNPFFLEGLELNYRPDHVMIEFNGTWDLNRVLEMQLPPGWEIASILSTVDAGTAQMYLTNMRNLFLAPLLSSDLVIVNRTEDNTDRAKIRRSIKVMNPGAQIVFEREDGEPVENTEEELPFDFHAPVIEVDEIDYGIWYLDAMEHPEHYKNKKIRFLAQVYKNRRLGEHTFVPGRFVMTCCAEDITFLGFICRTREDIPYKNRDWIYVTVTFRYEYVKQYKDKGPVLYLDEMIPAKKPQNDVVTFD